MWRCEASKSDAPTATLSLPLRVSHSSDPPDSDPELTSSGLSGVTRWRWQYHSLDLHPQHGWIWHLLCSPVSVDLTHTFWGYPGGAPAEVPSAVWDKHRSCERHQQSKPNLKWHLNFNLFASIWDENIILNKTFVSFHIWLFMKVHSPSGWNIFYSFTKFQLSTRLILRIQTWFWPSFCRVLFNSRRPPLDLLVASLMSAIVILHLGNIGIQMIELILYAAPCALVFCVFILFSLFNQSVTWFPHYKLVQTQSSMATAGLPVLPVTNCPRQAKLNPRWKVVYLAGQKGLLDYSPPSLGLDTHGLETKLSLDINVWFYQCAPDFEMFNFRHKYLFL